MSAEPQAGKGKLSGAVRFSVLRRPCANLEW